MPESHAPTSLATFEKVIAENEDKIFRAIHAYVGDYEDALDLTQETFIQAYRAFGKFRGDASVSTWLYRIAINLCKKHFKKKGRWAHIIAGSTDAPEIEPAAQRVGTRALPIDEHLVKEELARTVQAQIQSLPSKYRTVVVLKYLQGLAYEEIADVLSIRVGTVKSRLNRAKQMLGERLQAHL